MMTLDPTQLDADGKKMLFDLMEKAKDINLPAGQHTLPDGTGVFLQYSLLITERTPTRIHAEVLSDTIEKGYYGSVMNSLGQLRSENDMLFKQRPVEKQRVIKRIDLSNMSRKEIHKEALRTNIGDESLHCKNPVFSSQYGFLNMRKAGEMDFFKLQRLLYQRKMELYLLDYLEISLAIVTAVHTLHQKGRVHRDIKPENLMISLSPLNVRLIDFALCCPITKVQGKSPKGTLTFLPPEMFYTLNISQAGDILSLGLTLAEFWNDTSMEHIHQKAPGSIKKFYQHRQNETLKLFSGMDLPPDIAKPLSELLHGMIRFKPEERTPLKTAMETLSRLITIEQQRDAELSFSLTEDEEESIDIRGGIA